MDCTYARPLSPLKRFPRVTFPDETGDKVLSAPRGSRKVLGAVGRKLCREIPPWLTAARAGACHGLTLVLNIEGERHADFPILDLAE